MIETPILVGNAFSLCAMVSDSISGTRKKHSQITVVSLIKAARGDKDKTIEEQE